MLHLLTSYLHLGRSSSWALSSPWTAASFPLRAGVPKGRKTTLPNAWVMHSAWRRHGCCHWPLGYSPEMGAAGGEQREGQGERETGRQNRLCWCCDTRNATVLCLFTNKDVKRLLGAWEFSYSLQGFDCSLSYASGASWGLEGTDFPFFFSLFLFSPLILLPYV